MNYTAFFLLINLYVFINGMEQETVKMPTKETLENMFQDTTLSKLAQHYDEKKVKAFYELAEQDIEVNKLKNILQGFYADFEFLRLTSNIPKTLQCKNMNEVIAMEYVYFAKQLFKSIPNYWKIIEPEFENIVQKAGYKKFKFLNMTLDNFTKKNNT